MAIAAPAFRMRSANKGSRTRIESAQLRKGVRQDVNVLVSAVAWQAEIARLFARNGTTFPLAETAADEMKTRDRSIDPRIHCGLLLGLEIATIATSKCRGHRRELER
jgi:hypothetical protein